MTDPEDGSAVEAEQASAKIYAEMKASGHGRNYLAQGDMTFISTSLGLTRADRVQPYQLEEASDYLVPPPRYQDALNTLWNHQIVVLSADPGSGRHTVARSLFFHINKERQKSSESRPPVTVRELVPDWTEPDVHYLPSSPNSGYLLELARAGDKAPGLGFGQDLLDHAEALLDDDSYLVILTTDDEWRACALATSEITVPVVTPSAEAIATRRLERQFDCPNRLPYLKNDPFARILAADLSPENAVELAEAIAKAEDNPQSLTQVAERFQGWRKYLLDWFEKHPDISDRARMIAAALLGTAPDQAILDAADALLTLFDPHQNIESPLSGPDLSKRLEALDAERVGTNLSITLKRPRLDAAVLDHIWVERPQLRPTFSKWVLKITETAPVAQLSHIASQLVGLAVRQAPDTFLDVIEVWASGTAIRRRLVTEMLDLTVLDRAVGRDVREKMLAWARNLKTAPALRDVVAEVCGRRLATEKPEVALTRLRLVLSVEDHDPTVALGAVRIIASVPGLARPTLSRVRRWMTGEAPLAGARAFVALMHVDGDPHGPVLPILPTADGPEQEVLTELRRGWSAAIKRPDLRDDIAAAMLGWLKAADDGMLDTSRVVSVLAPVLADSLDRSLVGRVLRTSAATKSDNNLFTMSTGQQLFEAVMWPNFNSAELSTGADETWPTTAGWEDPT